jgi:hypothetical protein
MNHTLAELRAAREQREAKRARTSGATVHDLTADSDNDVCDDKNAAWTCTRCTFANAAGAVTCAMCQDVHDQDANQAAAQCTWACTECTLVNGNDVDVCACCAVGQKAGTVATTMPNSMQGSTSSMPIGASFLVSGAAALPSDGAAALPEHLVGIVREAVSRGLGDMSGLGAISGLGGGGRSDREQLMDMGARHDPRLVPFTDPFALYVNSVHGASFEPRSPHSLPRSPRTITLGMLCAGPVRRALFTVFDHRLDFVCARPMRHLLARPMRHLLSAHEGTLYSLQPCL